MKNNRTKPLLVLCFSFVIAVFLMDLLSSKFSLSVTKLSVVSDKTNDNIRIVQLTDLHNNEFGENNLKLVNELSEQDPDLILITGDLLNADQDDTSIATTLIEQLVPIANVYISMGNHEITFMERTGIDLKKVYSSAGAIVLDEAYTDIEVKGQELRIGGVYGYCLPQRFMEVNDTRQVQCNLLTEFQNTDRYKILMSHLPYAWWNYGFGNEWNVDLVLCGHTHGGQIIIPFVGGLYDAEIGWFPGQVAGYKKDGADIIVSRGLGNTEWFPRFNNTPEIVVIEIHPN